MAEQNLDSAVFAITDDTARDLAHEFVSRVPANDNWFVRVDQKRPARSEAQRRLWWLWVTDISRHEHDEKADVHDRCKYRFLRPVLIRDDESGVLDRLWATIEQTSDPAQIHAAMSLFHLSDPNVKQMAEILTDMEHWMVLRGVPFRHPDDLYLEAMANAHEARKRTP